MLVGLVPALVHLAFCFLVCAAVVAVALCCFFICLWLFAVISHPSIMPTNCAPGWPLLLSSHRPQLACILVELSVGIAPTAVLFSSRHFNQCVFGRPRRPAYLPKHDAFLKSIVVFLNFYAGVYRSWYNMQIAASTLSHLLLRVTRYANFVLGAFLLTESDEAFRKRRCVVHIIAEGNVRRGCPRHAPEQYGLRHSFS